MLLKKEYQKEALSAFDFAIISDDTFTGAYIEKGKLLESMGRINEAIDNYLNNQQKAQTQLIALEKEKQAAMRDVNKLRKTFANLDLDESALANPEDLQNRINRGSKRVLENLEKLTDPNQFDEESSNNN